MSKVETVLLRTSAASDVQRRGGFLSIAGLTETKESRISSVVQTKYKAEVVQVITVAATDYTVEAGETYGVLIGDPNRRRGGIAEQLKPYKFTALDTLADMGSTNAIRKEYITGQLVTQINNDPGNFCVAASLGSGNGFTITDDAGYYPAFSQTSPHRLGANTVKILVNRDGSGYAYTNITTTTAAVYSSGVGATLASGVPVVDAYNGGLISGYLKNGNQIGATTNQPFKTVAGLAAVSGQQYDIFSIVCLDETTAYGGDGSLKCFIPSVKLVAVDNGAGSDTTNSTGFLAFEKEMQRLALSVYDGDPSSMVDFFDSSATFGNFTDATTGLVTVDGNPVGDTGDVNVMNTGKNVFHYHVLGTQTKIVPNVINTGLQLDADATDNDGLEFAPHVGTACPQQYVIGKGVFSLYARVTITDVSDAEFLLFGFRKKEAFAAAYTTYTDLAAIGFDTETDPQPIKIITNLNDAASPTSTDTTLTWADAAVKDLEVRVFADGSVKFFINGVDKTSTQATAFSFDSGDTVIPFMYCELGTSSAPAVLVSRFASVPGHWRA